MKFYSAPDWASYIAMDKDGTWYAYENMPIYKDGVWVYEGRRKRVHPVVSTTLDFINKDTDK